MRNLEQSLCIAGAGIVALSLAWNLSSRSKAQGQETGGAAAGKSGYHLIKKVKLGGEGGWDYLTVDSASRRLFISRGTHVMVVDADSGKVLGDIPNTAGVHGIALVPEMNKGFTSNGRSETATIFDMKTLKTLGEAKTDKDPDAIIYDAGSKRVFTFNGDAATATAIDAATGKAVGFGGAGRRTGIRGCRRQGTYFRESGGQERTGEIRSADSEGGKYVAACAVRVAFRAGNRYGARDSNRGMPQQDDGIRGREFGKGNRNGADWTGSGREPL